MDARISTFAKSTLIHLERRLPVLKWARSYDRMTALADLIAGLTLGLMLVPQSIAYASLAGLPVQYGLYTAFLGTMLYSLLGTVKEVSIGPTSLMAFLTLQTCRGLPLEYLQLLTFLSGCVVALMGVLRLGMLVELISAPVTSGFTSGTAIIVVVSQLKGLLGLSFVAENVLENAQLIARNWHLVRAPDCLLGGACIAVLLSLRKLKDIKLSEKRARLRKTIWLVSIARNAIVVLIASTIAYCIHPSVVDPTSPGNATQPLFKLSGQVRPGLPPVDWPAFSVSSGNSTVGFGGMLSELGSAVLLVPVVMVLANIAIAKAFSEGRPVDAMQEMLALGLCNIGGAFMHAMPACGAFTRSAVSHSSGVRTPAAGIYAGVITLVALAFLTEYFYFIPKATLSAVLISAVVFMIDIEMVIRLWHRSRLDLAVLCATGAVCVIWSVELAVLVGAVANAALLLFACARPRIDITQIKVCSGECIRVRPHVALLYLNVERFAAAVTRTADATPALPVLVDCSQLQLLDYSACQVLKRVVAKFKDSGQKLVFYNASVQVSCKLEEFVSTESGANGALSAPCEEDALAAVATESREDRSPEARPLLDSPTGSTDQNSIPAV